MKKLLMLLLLCFTCVTWPVLDPEEPDSESNEIRIKNAVGQWSGSEESTEGVFVVSADQEVTKGGRLQMSQPENVFSEDCLTECEDKCEFVPSLKKIKEEKLSLFYYCSTKSYFYKPAC